MCNELTTFTKGHFRLLVKNWCSLYVTSVGEKRCGVNVVGEERPSERCSSMRHSYFPYFLRLMLTVNHCGSPRYLYYHWFLLNKISQQWCAFPLVGIGNVTQALQIDIYCQIGNGVLVFIKKQANKMGEGRKTVECNNQWLPYLGSDGAAHGEFSFS